MTWLMLAASVFTSCLVFKQFSKEHFNMATFGKHWSALEHQDKSHKANDR